MRIRALMIGLALAAAAIPAASVASPINKTDRINATRACTTLRTSLGASTFTQTYHSFGACVSKLTLTARTARDRATASCRGKSNFKTCVTTKTQSNLNVQVKATVNAAETCAQLRSKMVSQLGVTAGSQAFNATYGTNVNDKNAFGKCVSAHAKAKTAGQGTTTTTTTTSVSEFHANLSSVNNSGVSGRADLFLSGTSLTVALKLDGFDRNKAPTATINGDGVSDANCPTSAQDTDSNGVITYTEGTSKYGGVVLDLGAIAAANGGGHVVFVGHYTVNTSTLGTLTNRAIVIRGKTVGSGSATSDLDACGEITS